jgi:putative mycofactocin binding protein MftB
VVSTERRRGGSPDARAPDDTERRRGGSPEARAPDDTERRRGGSPDARAPDDTSAGHAAAGFDLDRAWQLDERVAVRPEPFGALLYHFGTRRLSLLKDPHVLAVLRALGEHPSARSACVAAGVGAAALPAYERALATLARSQMITPRDGP